MYGWSSDDHITLGAAVASTNGGDSRKGGNLATGESAIDSNSNGSRHRGFNLIEGQSTSMLLCLNRRHRVQQLLILPLLLMLVVPKWIAHNR